MSQLVETLFPSPVGTLRLVASDTALVAVLFPAHRRPPQLTAQADASHASHAFHDVLEQATRELEEYFAGRRRTFCTPLDPQGTEFQRAVWDALCTIPFGQTRSYAEQATLLQRPSAVRAVASANGRNPLSIFIPCHRVIGKRGTLSGYAGGLATKRWLLDHERGARRTPHGAGSCTQ
jgi:methylated-DNA-[protein]-cysteine S-methyltransferase